MYSKLHCFTENLLAPALKRALKTKSNLRNQEKRPRAHSAQAITTAKSYDDARGLQDSQRSQAGLPGHEMVASASPH